MEFRPTFYVNKYMIFKDAPNFVLFSFNEELFIVYVGSGKNDRTKWNLFI